MRKRVALLLSVAMLLTMLMGAGAAPASAGEVGAVAFSGTAFVFGPNGLCYPVVCGGPRTRSWTIAAAVCLDLQLQPKKATPATAGFCGLAAGGTPTPPPAPPTGGWVTGYCGQSVGRSDIATSGSPNYVDSAGQGYNVEVNWLSYGTFLLISGRTTKLATGQKGTFVGLVNARPVNPPPPALPSCATAPGGAGAFDVQGALAASSL